MNLYPPVPDNELDRLLTLSSLDLNYQHLNDSFADLARLAAGIAGTSISLVNLVDAYTQWSIAAHGMDIEQMPRQDSVCQYTILEDNFLEVPNLSLDERFRQKDYVVGDPSLVYYFGVPLRTDNGQNIGALCVLDRNIKAMNTEKLEMLKIIAREIVARLQAKKTEEELRVNIADLRETQKKLAHDIRGPIAGIIGLARLFKNKTYDSDRNKLQEVFCMIEDGGESVLGLAEDILKESKINKEAEQIARESQYNLPQFKEAIEKLYLPLSKSKEIQFQVKTGFSNLNTFFSRKMLMQISGNLLSNAIKFTPAGGSITVELLLEMHEGESL